MAKVYDVSKMLKVLFVDYTDFECIHERRYGCHPDPKRTSTIRLAHHVPCGFTYTVAGVAEELPETSVTYRGTSKADVFVEHMV